MPKPMPDQPSPARRFSWPVIVVLLLGGHATLIISAVTLAVTGTGRGVVPDYYAQAVDYDTHKRDLAASRALGWELALESKGQIDAQGRRTITATLKDAQGEPINDAVVDLRLTRLSDGRVDELKLSPRTEAGSYYARAELPAAGRYHAESVVYRGSQRFVQAEDLLVSDNTRPAQDSEGSP
ncbi:MAG: FixH family protein [Planctomycetota bacterium]